jgi:hypothetical protein
LEIHFSFKILLVRRPERKRALGRCRGRWEDNIKIDVKEIECGDVDWIHLARERIH